MHIPLLAGRLPQPGARVYGCLLRAAGLFRIHPAGRRNRDDNPRARRRSVYPVEAVFHALPVLVEVVSADVSAAEGDAGGD